MGGGPRPDGRDQSAQGRARKQAEIPGKERPSRKKRPVRRDTDPLAETEILSLDDFQIEAAEALREGLSSTDTNDRTNVANVVIPHAIAMVVRVLNRAAERF